MRQVLIYVKYQSITKSYMLKGDFKFGVVWQIVQLIFYWFVRVYSFQVAF